MENHWNGDPLPSVAHALEMAASMTYKREHPETRLIDGDSPKGVRLTKEEMKP